METTWADIGILAAFALALLVFHATLYSRIGSLGDEINRRFDETNREMNRRFDAVNARFDAMTDRIDRIVPELREETRGHVARDHRA